VQALDGAGNTSFYQLTISREPAATADTTAPSLVVQLVNDTGTSNSDRITSDPSISGTLVDDVAGSGIAVFRGGLDSTPAANFTDLSATLNSDGTFLLSAALLDSLAGGKLADEAIRCTCSALTTLATARVSASRSRSRQQPRQLLPSVLPRVPIAAP